MAVVTQAAPAKTTRSKNQKAYQKNSRKYNYLEHSIIAVLVHSAHAHITHTLCKSSVKQRKCSFIVEYPPRSIGRNVYIHFFSLVSFVRLFVC